MIFLHKSLNDPKYKNDRKLSLLKRGVITTAQFVNLIEPDDDYIIIGPAIVDRHHVKDFITEWKARQLNIESSIAESISSFSMDDAIAGFPIVLESYPEARIPIDLFNEQIKNSVCPKCTKNVVIESIVGIISKAKESDPGRDEHGHEEYFKLLLEKFGNIKALAEAPDFNKFDVEWIDPDSIVGIGTDLIDKLDTCLDCVIKHIGRAKILYEEFMLGYPEHKELFYDELAKGNKDIEQLYLAYMDSLSQLDMGSSELIGNLKYEHSNEAASIIELANEIRKERLLAQEDINKAPDFDGLRIKVKKLQLKIHNDKKSEQ